MTSEQKNQFQSAFGPFPLERYPRIKNTPLRAWSAADELALTYLKEQIDTGALPLPEDQLRILTVNDQDGALAFSAGNIPSKNTTHCWSDSSLSQQSLAYNTNLINSDDNNSLSVEEPTFIPSTTPLDGFYDMVLIQIPKTLSLLEYQLRNLRNHLKPHSLIIGAGMVKHLQHSYTELFEKLIGPTHTSLAKKKARLILPTFDPTLSIPAAPTPTQYSLEKWPITLTNLSNVFAQHNLDIGTRFFLPHIGANQEHIKTIFDLGCGNGALGIAASQLNPEATIGFYDDSYLAVSSAELSFKSNNIENAAHFKAMDCLSDEKNKADLILCNPPFHQNNTVGTQIALRMFHQAKQHLTKHGELRVVGNRHLNYQVPLKRLFSNVKVLDSNKKFSIYAANNVREQQP